LFRDEISVHPSSSSFSFAGLSRLVEAKWGSSTHAGSSNMISAMIKYGTDHNRFKALTPEDMTFARKHIDPELMRLFQYAQPPTLLEEAPAIPSTTR
jgi:hypothetical protein